MLVTGQTGLCGVYGCINGGLYQTGLYGVYGCINGGLYQTGLSTVQVMRVTFMNYGMLSFKTERSKESRV